MLLKQVIINENRNQGMRTFYEHKMSCPSLKSTSASFYPQRIYQPQQNNSYLSTMNYRLLVTISLIITKNEITDSQTEKNYYRTRLNEQFHSHHNELQYAYTTISEKNTFIIQLEEQLDRMSKDYRVLSDEYVGLKNQMENLKNLHNTELDVLKRNHVQKIKQIEDQASIRVQSQVNKRVGQVEAQCQQRVKMFKSQLEEAHANSTQLSHELKLLQQDYHQMMAKNQTIIQQSILREIRKRDFQMKNNQLEDNTQQQLLKKINQSLKTDINTYLQQISSFQQENKKLTSQNIILKTKLKDIQEAFEYEKTNNRVKLQQKYKDYEEMETNTEQQFVPVILPVQTNLIGEIIALKEFLTEKMILRYEEFFTKASLKEKKKSASLITFKNYMAEQVKNATESSLLLHLHTGMQRIVKLYCPAMSYTREFLTVKDQFIRKSLMECQGIANKQQKLFRLLQLIHRLHQPITHTKSQISIGQLRMVEIKILASLKKIYGGA